jgi:hypothetical protein
MFQLTNHPELEISCTQTFFLLLLASSQLRMLFIETGTTILNNPSSHSFNSKEYKSAEDTHRNGQSVFTLSLAPPFTSTLQNLIKVVVISIQTIL